jgi:hypothetical protein
LTPLGVLLALHGQEQLMKTSLMLILLSFALQTAEAQKSGGCVNPSIQWTINPMYIDGTTPSAIQGDGSPYIDGQPGVTALIYVCSGSFDATLLLGHNRTLSFDFSRLLASNSNTPSWALNGGTQSGTGFLNVRYILFVPAGTDRNHEYTFNTWLGSNPPQGGNFRMANPSPDPPLTGGGGAFVNTPYPNSLIVVHHCPANSNTATCPNITHETWFAYPSPNPTASGVGQTGLPITQVGTLLTTAHGSQVNAGQFSMPFYFAISLLN